MNAPSLALEAQRLAAVQRYQILDTPPDGAFDRITAIAARLFQVPIALVTIVDHDRIWFKSRQGVEISEIDRELGLCASTILQEGVYTVTDALSDPRTLTNSLVRGEFGLRFYAAVPLKTGDGYHLGTLCVIDHQPRDISPDETQILTDLAAIVMDEMELRLAARNLVDTTEAQRQAINDLYHHAPCGYHSLDHEGIFVQINNTELRWLGYQRHEVIGKLSFYDLLAPDSKITFATNFPAFKKRGRVNDLEFELKRADGSTFWVLVNAIADYDEQGHYLKSRSTMHNINDRKQAELALRQLNQSLEAKVKLRTAQLSQRNAALEASNHALHLSEARFRNAFDYASIGMAIVSLDGRWLEVNPALCDITGYTMPELLATDFQAMTHPDDLEEDLNQAQQLLNGEIHYYHLEKRYRHKNGHWIWILLSGSLVRDLEHKPLYFVSQIQDIHKRKQATLALQESQTMLLKSQEIGHLGSWEYDVPQQTVTWSAEKFRILGRNPTLGEPSFEELLRVHHPESGEQLRQLVNQSLATGEPYRVRLKFQRCDGSIGYLEERGEAELNDKGEVVRLFGIAQDITERVQAERDLKEMRNALAHAIEGISRLDNDGHYVQVNQAYAAMAGYTPEELVGQHWSVTIHPDDLPRVTQAYEEMLSEGKVNLEARGIRKDGSLFYKQLFMVVVYDDQRQRQGHYCFMKDISERAQLEAERQQAQIALQEELERLSQVVQTQQEVALVNPHLGKVMSIIATQAQQLSHGDGAAVELLEDEELVCHYRSGVAKQHPEWRLPLEQSLSGQSLKEGRALYCGDSETDKRINRELFESMGLRSMLVAPLSYQAGQVGILKVFSTQRNAFTESDLQTLQLMAGLLTASLNLALEFEVKTSLLQDLRDSEERYRSVVLALSEGIAVIQADGQILTCNASAFEILGLSSQDMIGRTITELKHTIICEDGSLCPVDEYPIWVTLRSGTPISQQTLGIVKDTTTTWISVNTQPLYCDSQGQPDAVVVSFTDITESRRSEVATLRRQAEQERLLSDIAQRIRQTLDLEVILQTTVTEVQQFLRINRVMIYRLEADGSGVVIAEAITHGLPSLLGKTIDETVEESEAREYQAGQVRACTDIEAEEGMSCPMDVLTQAKAKLIVPIVQGKGLWGLLLAYHSQGPRSWEQAELDVLTRLATQIAIAIQQSQLYQHLQTANEQLAHLATHDGLTQLANRRSFDTYLAREWSCLVRRQAPLSLILCDIDYFKSYNDTYGHPAGDRCLQEVAAALQEVVKRPADLLARYGGEEFVIVLPVTDADGAEAIAVEIQETLEQRDIFHGESPLGERITLSLGVATVIPTSGRSPQLLIDRADAALYAAKHHGRNQYQIFLEE